MTAVEELAARIDAAERALEHYARTPPPPSALTRADPQSGERWDAGQAWAHLAEFVPYWRGEAERVVDAGGTEPVPFGRVQSDPGRVAGIEEGRRELPTAQMDRLSIELGALRGWLAQRTPAELERVGMHPTRGEMTVHDIIERFVVGHLEEHVVQLAELETPEARR